MYAFLDSTLGRVYPALKEIIDQELAVLTRRLVYVPLLDPKNMQVWSGLCTSTDGSLYRLVLNMGVGNRLTASMAETLGTNDKVGVDGCILELKEVFGNFSAMMHHTHR